MSYTHNFMCIQSESDSKDNNLYCHFPSRIPPKNSDIKLDTLIRKHIVPMLPPNFFPFLINKQT